MKVVTIKLHAVVLQDIYVTARLTLIHSHCVLLLVPFLTVNVKALNDKATVYQPFILECTAMTTRGVNSRVDVVWSSNGTELEKIEAVDVNNTTSFSTVYTHVYTLNVTEPGGTYQCEAIININPPMRATSSIVTLDVAGT